MVSERKEIDFLKQFSAKFSYIQLYFCFERLQRNLTKITFVNESLTVQDLNSPALSTLEFLCALYHIRSASYTQTGALTARLLLYDP